jgi:hypothetical protein
MGEVAIAWIAQATFLKFYFDLKSLQIYDLWISFAFINLNTHIHVRVPPACFCLSFPNRVTKQLWQ